jgi:hypothetical protein
MRLKSVNFSEKRGEKLEYSIQNLSLGDFNLLISDNAQGKTRLFRIFNFMRYLVLGLPRLIVTNFHGEFIFTTDLTSDKDVKYIIDIIPEGGTNTYHEIVSKNGTVLFSSKEKILINEKTDKKIETIFLPKNIPAIASIDEDDYPTIKSINQYFRRIIYLSSNKSRQLGFSFPDAIIPDEDGQTISTVMYNWSKQYPERFNDVINDFKEIFNDVIEINFNEEKIGNITNITLTLKEKGIDQQIVQADWSDGMFRILHLLMLTRSPFKMGNKIVPPSLILIDEIENGLDYKRLKAIIQHFIDYQDESQIILSSHSPLVCDFIHPNNWHIVKRKGSAISFLSPKDVEKDLDGQLNSFKQKHWEFYAKHISNSDLYSVK